MKDNLTVSLLQVLVKDDLDYNLENASQHVKKAKKEGADIVVLPEMFCCPYQNEAFVRYREPAGGKIWHALSDMAADNGVYLIGGSMPEEEDGNIYNTSFVFSPSGEQIARHRKVHLFDIDVPGGQQFFESHTFKAGSSITIVDTEFGKIGILICFDVRFPEITRVMALEGIRALFVPAAFNSTTGPAHWEIHFRGRAVDNQIFTFGCAPALNPESSYASYGNSIAVDPWGRVLQRLGNEEGILNVSIDLNNVNTVREQLPLLKNRRSDLYKLDLR